MKDIRIVFPHQATVSYIDTLLKAVRQVLDVTEGHVTIDLSETSEVSAILICFLCALRDLSLGKKNIITLLLPRNKRAAAAIRSTQELFKSPDSPARIAERMCQVRKISGNNNAALEEILDLLKEAIPMTEDARSSLLVVLTELLTNVIDHSGEKFCYVCAGSWGKSKDIHVTILDLGVGIPQKIRTRYPGYEKDVDVMRVLMEKGLTTRVMLEGGRGYRLIQDILRENKGRLYVFSGRAKIAFKYDKGEYQYRKAHRTFTGTCVDIQFRPMGSALFHVIGAGQQGGFF